MRQIGNVQTEAHLERLIDYLLTRGIRAQADRAGEGWSVWVYDEDRVAEAREILDRFQARPDDAEFVNAGAIAEKIRSEAIAREKQFRKQVVDVRSLWSNPRTATRPVTILLIVISVVVGFMTKFG